jgi:predicted CopG family antitoxin
MSNINISDVKITISQSLKDAKKTFSTLREELPKRIKGPITVTTEIFGTKSTRTYKPFDPSYNQLDR